MTKTKNRLEISLDDLRQAPQTTSTTAPQRRPPVPAFPPVQKRVAFDHGYAAEPPPPPPSTGTATGGRSRKAPLFAALGAVLAVVLIAGAVLVGQSTRKSDSQIAIERQQAVGTAVSATQRQAAIEKQGAVEDAVTTQQRHDQAVTRRVRRRLQRSADRRAQQSYTQGQATGYSSGQADGYQNGQRTGYQDGMHDATDQVTCSDDPDVPLPYCN